MLTAATILATAAVALAACRGEVQPSAEVAPPIPVRVASPQLRSAEPDLVLTGVLAAKEEIPLAFKIGGVVSTVAVEPGDRVIEGQLLAALSLTEIDASVAAAREARDKARRDLARVERLERDSVTTLAQAEDARTGLAVAEAQLRAAEFNRQYAEVRAPAAGVILRKQIQRGQLVGPGLPMFVLRVEREGLVLRVGAADREAQRLTEGMRATIQFDAYPEMTFAGRIARVGMAASPLTGTTEVEVVVEPAGRRLASGVIGRARITPQATAPVLVIPAEALLEVDGREATLFVLDAAGAAVQRTRVQVLWLDGGVAAVRGKLDAASRVVIAGASRLAEGSPVIVMTPGAP
jgi:multidrug efflux system membrane fusion protein